MPGPVAKHASARQRRNKASTAAVLKAVEDPTVPELPMEPDGGWHPMVLDYWDRVWSSPMAPEYVDADFPRLVMCAVLHNDFWTGRSPTARKEAATEIRLQEKMFGLTPADRRSLQWQIEAGESAEEKTERRRRARAPRPAEETGDDPRALLA